MTGTVKWFNAHKGYGFITEEDGNEIFVHYSSINADGFKVLNNGQKVTYDKKETEKGTVALNVVGL